MMTFLPRGLVHLVNVLRAGQELAKPGAWKNVQLIGSLLTALLGLLWAAGIEIRLLPDDIFAIAGTIVALINGYLTVATSKKVGIPSASAVDPVPHDDDERVRDAAALLAELRAKVYSPDRNPPAEGGDR